MALVKDVYNLRFYNQLTDILQGVFPLFEKDNFIKDIFSTGFDNMEYKERMRHTTQVLHSYMPDDYPKAVEILLKLTGELEKVAAEDSQIKMGDSLTFSFEIENGLDKELDVRIEYAIYYMKANASRRTRRSGHYQW